MKSMGHFHLITCGTFSFNYDKEKICKKKADDYSSACSGAKEDRTPDPLLAKQVLSQLSYNPIR